MTAFLLAPLLSLACAARSEPPELAGGVVQSQEWHVARSTAGVEREEFIGEVRYQAGQTAARCDHALYRHAERTWSLDGHVRLDKRLPSGDRLQAQGDSAFLNMGRRSGWLEGKPVLL
ncbi:MAG: hypothetical protein KGK30_07575, partial [Elusimicrobia bacterium]|nr:hypothetical protein [Elusimicrobiota bacterium]